MRLLCWGIQSTTNDSNWKWMKLFCPFSSSGGGSPRKTGWHKWDWSRTPESHQRGISLIFRIDGSNRRARGGCRLVLASKHGSNQGHQYWRGRLASKQCVKKRIVPNVFYYWWLSDSTVLPVCIQLKTPKPPNPILTNFFLALWHLGSQWS